MARKQSHLKSGIGKRIEDLRKARGLSQEELASALHMSRSSLNMRERGERGVSCEDAVLVADYFGISTDELIRGMRPNNTEIHAATGLSDSAIETIRHFKENDSTGRLMAVINKAFASRSFLNVLSSVLSVKSSERGYHEAILSPNDDFYNVEMSSDSYVASLMLRLLLTLEAIRTGNYAALQDYGPAVRREAAVIEQLRAEGRLIENGGGARGEETG